MTFIERRRVRRFAEREQVTTTAFITHRDCQLHDMGSHHPECPQRLTAISDHLIAQGLDAYFVYYDAPLATFEQLMRVHPASHLERIKRASPELGVVHLDPDTAMNPAYLAGCFACCRCRLPCGRSGHEG
jgi:acetoin utilization deacetylase AcuC-like enzyme